MTLENYKSYITNKMLWPDTVTIIGSNGKTEGVIPPGSFFVYQSYDERMAVRKKRSSDRSYVEPSFLIVPDQSTNTATAFSHSDDIYRVYDASECVIEGGRFKSILKYDNNGKTEYTYLCASLSTGTNTAEVFRETKLMDPVPVNIDGLTVASCDHGIAYQSVEVGKANRRVVYVVAYDKTNNWRYFLNYITENGDENIKNVDTTIFVNGKKYVGDIFIYRTPKSDTTKQ